MFKYTYKKNVFTFQKWFRAIIYFYLITIDNIVLTTIIIIIINVSQSTDGRTGLTGTCVKTASRQT